MKALISVADKTGLLDFARGLEKLGIEIIATTGTAQFLAQDKIVTTDIPTVTGFPDIMNGCVKTLHPAIVGGILGQRALHQSEASAHHIPWIDLVVCNFLPLPAIVCSVATPPANATTICPAAAKVIEAIDIGGPTMVRAAAKNYLAVTVIVDPADYPRVLEELSATPTKTISLKTRQELAFKAFAHASQYDATIADHLNEAAQQDGLGGELFPAKMTLSLDKVSALRYGENPHQIASAYRFNNNQSGLLSAKQYQGRKLSFNNLCDADFALNCLTEFSKPACIVVKHVNPCGIAEASSIDIAFISAWLADAKSAYGGLIALNTKCTATIAEYLDQIFTEVIVAPDYEAAALKILKHKKNLRVLEVPDFAAAKGHKKYSLKPLTDGILVQTPDNYQLTEKTLKCVTKRQLTPEMIRKLIFAWRVVKHAKSNGIVIATTNSDDACVNLGVGGGQVSRIGAIEIALRKAGTDLAGAVLASDGFLPFRDNIDILANSGIEAIVQPGGSMRDPEVIAACDELGIAMAFTNVRNFNH
jgi:phosphoribosylaminoimidazolecarboxamide formyltransferase / IMP cyclohydrolase